MDKLTTEQRHANMAAIQSKDTKPNNDCAIANNE